MQTVITNGRLKSIRLTNVERKRIGETKVLLGTLSGILPDLVPAQLVDDIGAVFSCLEKAEGKLIVDDPQLQLPFEQEAGGDEEAEEKSVVAASKSR